MNIVHASAPCAFLFLLIISNVAAQTKHPLEDHLLVASNTSVNIFDTNGNQRELISSTAYSTSIDYDCTTGEIFWTDRRSQEVYVKDPRYSRQRLAVKRRGYLVPASIAVDSVTHKIYVADRSSGTVSLYDLNSDKFTVVVGSDLTDVFGLAIDVNECYLFIQDEFSIIRTDLDGENSFLIYMENAQRNSASSSSAAANAVPLQISRITVDPETKRLFWADNSKNQVVSVNYSGKDKIVYYQGTSGSKSDRILDSVTVLNGVLYWADDVEQTYKIDLKSKNKQKYTLLNVRGRFMKAVSCLKRRKIVNHCQNNGNCEHICVLSKTSSNNVKCLCQTGYELANNNTSCIPVKEYIVFTMEGYLRAISITNSREPKVEVIDPTAIRVNEGASLDVNVKDKIVYYVSKYPEDLLHQVNLNEGTAKLLEPAKMNFDKSKLAFDWASRNLYYFATYNENDVTLCVLNINTPTFYKILFRKVNELSREIVVHPNRGHLYFSQYDVNAVKITRANLDGSNPAVIYTKSRNYIKGMALDYKMDRLYWIEHPFTGPQAVKSNILHSNLDGGDLKNLKLPSVLEELDSIAIHDNFIYVISKHKSILRLKKAYTSDPPIIVTINTLSPSIYGLQVFSPAIQTPRSDHPCARNHQCQYFCFAVPNGSSGLKAVCGCPYGTKLARNGKSCIDNEENEPQSGRIAAPAA